MAGTGAHTKELWQQEAEAAGVPGLASMVGDILGKLDSILDELRSMNTRHASHEEAIGRLHAAFPHTDLEGHRRYHATMIEMLAERRKLRQAVVEKTIAGLIWSGFVFVGLALYHELRDRLTGFIGGG